MPNKLICFECIGESYLSEQTRLFGEKGKECSYCGEEDTSVFPIEYIADHVSTVFDHSYSLTPNEPNAYESMLLADDENDYDWEREGEAPIDIVADIVNVSYEIAEDVINALDSANQVDERRNPGAEAPFNSEARYESVGRDEEESEKTWESLTYGLHHSARFFNTGLRSFLDSLFSDIHIKDGRNGKAIRIVEPGSKIAREIYRARVSVNRESVKEILSGLPATLGAPTGRKVRAGRMNAAGISVFYGACDRDTCLAEVRAPVGSSVVIGQFELVRAVKLLDLDALGKLYVTKSLFNPGYSADLEKCSFLALLSRRFSMPVIPGGEDFDYLLSQAVCEYLAGSIKPQLDGIIFKSSQRGGNGKNITLFNHASFVELPKYPPGTKFASYHLPPDDDGEESYAVSVQLPAEDIDEVRNNTSDNHWLSSVTSTFDTDIPSVATLRLRTENVEVIEILGVSYSKRILEVRHHEFTGEPGF
ncbi:RES family NAD+ phosphorylase [Massilia rhizosphaerae]|uniref:RES family NAD+ phosphorylase n=1 Tax=Massilia rhizosphaerae TaxID=2784389 RepID=UPI0018DC02C5|nr:RES family NAD+ phosphorylase [Massilia rhizosphaerae]